MKKSMFIAMIAAVMMIGTAAAQEQQANNAPKREKPTAEQMAKFRTERMAKALELNDEQQKQIYDYTLNRINEAQKKAEAARSEMEAARKSNAEQMQKILTPEQYAKWVELQKQQAQMGRAKGQQGWQGHGPQRGHAPQAGQAPRDGHHGHHGPAPKPECGKKCDGKDGNKECCVKKPECCKQGKGECCKSGECCKQGKGECCKKHEGHKPEHKPAEVPADKE